MIRNKRIIPVLLIEGEDLVKTVRFTTDKYLGDPINALKIFNDKYVDEIIVLDIESNKKDHAINFELLHEMAGECFMPICYGGGIKTIDDVKKIIQSGVERICINTEAFLNPNLIKKIVQNFGSSTLVIGIDYKRDFFNKEYVYIQGGKKKLSMTPIEAAKYAEELGAGEILIQSIVRDGVMNGYDLDLLKKILSSVTVPVIYCGGAGKADDVKIVNEIGASAAAGSLFVYKGKHKAKLINYPIPR